MCNDEKERNSYMALKQKFSPFIFVKTVNY